MGRLCVSWFSTGVSSAVATKLAIDSIERIVYIDIDDQHEDSIRFVKDCEQWYGKEIEILKSHLCCVENAVFSAGGKGYINGPGGASCTMKLKKRVRKGWEVQQYKNFHYIWGMDKSEQGRADRLLETMPKHEHSFPLIENNITKKEAHQILKASGIKRPVMYDLGYHNNNCVGCVKGGMGYWNKIREDFPEVFKKRAEMERKVGASCINGTYLDELDPERGRHEGPIVDDCGIFCELQAME